jgi:hypothetical protein
MRGMAFMVLLPLIACGAVVLDRIAVVAGNHPIKLSDIERDVRLTEFINREPISFTTDAKRASAERLITQEIIRQEILAGGYRRPAENEADALKAQILRDRFGGSEQRLRAALQEYGVSESELRAYLLWQLTVLQFIDQRFRAGVVITDEDIRNYYAQHQAQLRKQYPKDSSLEALTPKIKEQLESERINQNFDEWLDQARQGYRVDYKQGAFE